MRKTLLNHKVMYIWKVALTLLILPLPSTPSHTYTEMTERRREVVEKLHEFEQTIDAIVQLFEDPEVQEYVENRKWGDKNWLRFMRSLSWIFPYKITWESVELFPVWSSRVFRAMKRIVVQLSLHGIVFLVMATLKAITVAHFYFSLSLFQGRPELVWVSCSEPWCE